MTQKQLPGGHCLPEGSGQPPAILITGTAGHASKINRLQLLLRAHSRNHSQVQIQAGWKLAVKDAQTILPNRDRFHNVYHLVEHPLQAIARAMTLSDDDWSFIENITRIVRKDLPLLQRALYYWVSWNFILEMIADQRFQHEQLDFQTICALINNTTCPKHPLRGSREEISNTGSVSWDDLENIDPFVTVKARDMAVKYGYDL